MRAEFNGAFRPRRKQSAAHRRADTFTILALHDLRRRVAVWSACLLTLAAISSVIFSINVGLSQMLVQTSIAFGLMSLGGLHLALAGKLLLSHRILNAVAVISAVLWTLAIPNLGTLTIFVPVVLHITYVEQDRRWIGAQALCLIGAAVLSLQTEATRQLLDTAIGITNEGSVWWYCAGAGFLSALVIGTHRNSDLALHLTSRAYAERQSAEVVKTRDANDRIAAHLAELEQAHAAIEQALAEEEQGQHAIIAAEAQLHSFAEEAEHWLRRPLNAIEIQLQQFETRFEPRRRQRSTKVCDLQEVASQSAVKDQTLGSAFAKTDHTLGDLQWSDIAGDVAYIRQSCAAIETLLDRLEDYHRTASTTENRVETVDVHALFLEIRSRESLALLHRRAALPAEAGATVPQLRAACEAFAHAGNSPIQVSCLLELDRRHLHSILTELIRNAIRFQAGARVPQVDLLVGQGPKGGIRLSVVDNGIGIAPEFTERVFGMFKRLHIRETYPGSGLGLPLVRRTAELVGAEVTLESDFAIGTTVHVDFPVAS